MKCANCKMELVIVDGKEGGYCHGCGSEFRVEKGTQVHDAEASDKFADLVADKVFKRLKPPEPSPDPPDPPDDPEEKWDL